MGPFQIAMPAWKIVSYLCMYVLQRITPKFAIHNFGANVWQAMGPIQICGCTLCNFKPYMFSALLKEQDFSIIWQYWSGRCCLLDRNDQPMCVTEVTCRPGRQRTRRKSLPWKKRSLPCFFFTPGMTMMMWQVFIEPIEIPYIVSWPLRIAQQKKERQLLVYTLLSCEPQKIVSGNIRHAREGLRFLEIVRPQEVMEHVQIFGCPLHLFFTERREVWMVTTFSSPT